MFCKDNYAAKYLLRLHGVDLGDFLSQVATFMKTKINGNSIYVLQLCRRQASIYTKYITFTPSIHQNINHTILKDIIFHISLRKSACITHWRHKRVVTTAVVTRSIYIHTSDHIFGYNIFSDTYCLLSLFKLYVCDFLSLNELTIY